MRGHRLPLSRRQSLEMVIADAERRLAGWLALPNNPHALEMDLRYAAEQVEYLRPWIVRKQAELDALEAPACPP